mmetsp:Transcript_19705/g.36964  ORF Transcript_19705/g.36964 Transcript_19705/m.36964 type:complete len:273 (-) Transcript_19705:4582-5400(-)
MEEVRAMFILSTVIFMHTSKITYEKLEKQRERRKYCVRKNDGFVGRSNRKPGWKREGWKSRWYDIAGTMTSAWGMEAMIPNPPLAILQRRTTKKSCLTMMTATKATVTTAMTATAMIASCTSSKMTISANSTAAKSTRRPNRPSPRYSKRHSIWQRPRTTVAFPCLESGESTMVIRWHQERMLTVVVGLPTCHRGSHPLRRGYRKGGYMKAVATSTIRSKRLRRVILRRVTKSSGCCYPHQSSRARVRATPSNPHIECIPSHRKSCHCIYRH